ncbi:DUF72 domain-containing protein [candidate division KSB1 bacterium]|nr:DUF72 domain-containing protein [candidate division KSB1 bacterium]
MKTLGLYIGPAGWSYKDWEGIVYPAKKGKNFHHLRYISDYFTTVEINSSFYRPPNAGTTTKWISLVHDNPDFLFTYKLWQKFTHDTESRITDSDERLVKSGLDVINDSGRLGATLIQLPWSFKNTDENKNKLHSILEMFRDYHPVVEIRHGSWDTDAFYTFLREEKAGFVNIDQPVIGDSIKLSAVSTGQIGYLRLHGRNYQNWFNENADASFRYDYTYNREEMNELAQRIGELTRMVSKTFMIFNNHYKGQAIANALQAMFIMTKHRIEVPPTMLEHYGELSEIAANAGAGQIGLF